MVFSFPIGLSSLYCFETYIEDILSLLEYNVTPIHIEIIAIVGVKDFMFCFVLMFSVLIY